MVIGHNKLVAFKIQAKNYDFLPVCFLWCSGQKKENGPSKLKNPCAFALIVILVSKYS
jgi:hypothetical protein